MADLIERESDMPSSRSVRRYVDLVVVLCALVASNLATAVLLDSWPEAVAQVLAAIALVAFAGWRGYSADSLGLSPRAVRAGLRLGAIVSGVIVLGVVAIAVVPFGRSFLEDDRFSDLSGWSAMYQLVIRIPLVTALSEELMFRSVLLAVLLTIVSTRWAVVWSSVAFGLWHVLATLGDLGGNAATDSLGAVERVGSVAGVVVVTAIAGVIFAWTRLRSESLVAPWMIHVAFNGATFAAGLAVAA
jgi:membrane protease YdiL (CAAX protease family)